MAAKKASGARAKTLTNEDTIAGATKFVAFGLSADKFTLKQGEERVSLWDTIQKDVLKAMTEENLAYGNYQIPVGTTGMILEVPLSVATGVLSPQDFTDLATLPAGEMTRLFEETEGITQVTDVKSLLKFILASNDPSAFVKVSSGIVTLVGLDQAPGIAREKTKSPKKGFFVLLDESLQTLRADVPAVQALTNWVKGRIKAAFRVGNRPAAAQ